MPRSIGSREVVMMKVVLWPETYWWWPKVAAELGLKMFQKCGRDLRKMGGDARVDVYGSYLATWCDLVIRMAVGQVRHI